MKIPAILLNNIILKILTNKLNYTSFNFHRREIELI